MSVFIGADADIFQQTARGALAGAEVGEPVPFHLARGRWLVQSDQASIFAQAGASATVQGIRLDPMTDGTVIEVTGRSVTFHARARGPLDAVITCHLLPPQA